MNFEMSYEIFQPQKNIQRNLHDFKTFLACFQTKQRGFRLN